MKNNIYVINLDERKDRLLNIQSEFSDKLHKEFIRFSAIKKDDGRLGCTLSHIECLEMAKNKDLDYCIICEDDAFFTIEETKFNFYLEKFLENNSLNILVFIHTINKKHTIKKHNDYFYTSDDIQTTTCYAVKKQFYDLLLQNFNYSKATLLTDKGIPLDETWKTLQKEHIFVFPQEVCGYQYLSYSNIRNKIVDKRTKMISTFEIKTKSISKKIDKKLNVEKLDIKKPNIKKINVKKTNVKKTNVKKTNVKKTNIKKPNVKKTNVKKTNIKKPNVKKTNVKKTNVKKTNVKKTNVKKTNVKKTNVKKLDVTKENTKKTIKTIILKNQISRNKLEKKIDSIH